MVIAMAYRHWTLDDIPWEKFDRSKVDPEVVKIIKAAAMVEFNAADYVAYLESVFGDDPAFRDAARAWGLEEVQHGQALSRWAQLSDPDFDFEERFKTFRARYPLRIDAASSTRGSRTGELVARCLVEVGTSSYYTAIADATDEPVLQVVCRRVGADELRHYKLFYDHLRRYVDREQLSRLRRIWVAYDRFRETEDDELGLAYYAANNNGEEYDRKAHNRAYMRRATLFYKPAHIERSMAMIFKAVGLKPHSRLFRVANAGMRWYLQRTAVKLARIAA